MSLNDSINKLQAAVVEIYRRVNSQLSKSAEVDRKLPQVLDTLVANGRITADQRAAAAAMIKDASRCLDFIEALAKHRPGSVGTSLGTPVANTSGSTARRAIGAPIVDFDETEAGRAFKEILSSGRTNMRW